MEMFSLFLSSKTLQSFIFHTICHDYIFVIYQICRVSICQWPEDESLVIVNHQHRHWRSHISLSVKEIKVEILNLTFTTLYQVDHVGNNAEYVFSIFSVLLMCCKRAVPLFRSFPLLENDPSILLFRGLIVLVRMILKPLDMHIS